MHEPNVTVQTQLTVARSELILGGQKSGKSRRAELLAAGWVAAHPCNSAVLIATAQPWDDEMRERITRHRHDRALRVPAMTTVEEPLELARAVALHSRADTLVVVDCLTLWLTNLLMPADEPSFASEKSATETGYAYEMPLATALQNAAGPVVLVANEIGLGVIPLGREVRHFVDALGHLNQHMARLCTRVTLMAAGLPLAFKEET